MRFQEELEMMNLKKTTEKRGKLKKNNSFLYGHRVNSQEQKLYDSFQQHQKYEELHAEEY